MQYPKLKASIVDVTAGTILIIVGLAGVLVRLGALDLSNVPQWLALEQWWPLLLIIVGLLSWLVDGEPAGESRRSARSVEMPYGK